MARTRPHSREAFPAPVAPGDQDVSPVQPDEPGQAVLSSPYWQGLEVCPRSGIVLGGDDGGQGVADLAGGSYCLTVSTTLARTDATAPLASGLALPLHWPLCLPEVYLGSKAAK